MPTPPLGRARQRHEAIRCSMKSTLSLREDDTQEVKESLRRELRQRRGRLTAEQRARASHAASTHLLALPELSGAVIAVFAAIRDEADPAHAVAALARRGKVLVYPRVSRGQPCLRFHRVLDPTELVPSAFGVPEPTPAHAEVALEHIDAVVVPGLAFDPRGHRLGWGKGYYDATLARCPAVRVGFAFQSQVIAEVPADAHDLPMDLLVTETGAQRISARARATATSHHEPS